MSLPHKHIGIAIVHNHLGQILIDRRRDSDSMGGLWEFPGGKIELDETVEDCIKREILEEIGIDIEVNHRLLTIEHTYQQLKVTLYVHHCFHVSGEPQPLECQEVRWVGVTELDQFQFPEANRQILASLQA